MARYRSITRYPSILFRGQRTPVCVGDTIWPRSQPNWFGHPVTAVFAAHDPRIAMAFLFRRWGRCLVEPQANIGGRHALAVVMSPTVRVCPQQGLTAAIGHEPLYFTLVSAKGFEPVFPPLGAMGVGPEPYEWISKGPVKTLDVRRMHLSDVMGAGVQVFAWNRHLPDTLVSHLQQKVQERKGCFLDMSQRGFLVWENTLSLK